MPNVPTLLSKFPINFDFSNSIYRIIDRRRRLKRRLERGGCAFFFFAPPGTTNIVWKVSIYRNIERLIYCIEHVLPPSPGILAPVVFMLILNEMFRHIYGISKSYASTSFFVLSISYISISYTESICITDILTYTSRITYHTHHELLRGRGPRWCRPSTGSRRSCWISKPKFGSMILSNVQCIVPNAFCPPCSGIPVSLPYCRPKE